MRQSCLSWPTCRADLIHLWNAQTSFKTPLNPTKDGARRIITAFQMASWLNSGHFNWGELQTSKNTTWASARLKVVTNIGCAAQECLKFLLKYSELVCLLCFPYGLCRWKCLGLSEPGLLFEGEGNVGKCILALASGGCVFA